MGRRAPGPSEPGRVELPLKNLETARRNPWTEWSNAVTFLCVAAATIRYIPDHLSRRATECVLTAESPIDVVIIAMRRVRELNGKGALVLWVEFQSDGTTRRHYPNGRSRPRRSPGLVEK